MTKEEILRDKFKNNFLDVEYLELVVEAMDEYAEQEVVAFYLWSVKEIGQYVRDIKTYKYDGLADEKKKEIEIFETATVPQRYDLYIQSKNKKP